MADTGFIDGKELNKLVNLQNLSSNCNCTTSKNANDQAVANSQVNTP